MAHTPGPWKLWDGHGAIRNNPIIVDSIPNQEGKFVGNCICYVATTNPDCQANADLIAAAPDMLRIVKRIATFDWIGETEMGMMRRQCIEIMEKVEGKNE